MGKGKKGYNWRARTNIAGSVDNAETVKLASKIELETKQNVDLEGSNALILPSRKRKFKADKDNEPIGKILSKKKRKHLEKIVERKKKKEQRGELLEKLEKVQADSSLLEKMVSLSSVQTKGLKKQFAEEEWKERMEQAGVVLEQVVVDNHEEMEIELPKKVKLKKPKKPEEIHINDPNVLGFEVSSSESEDESEIEETNDKENEKVEEKEPEEVEELETEQKPEEKEEPKEPEKKKDEFVEKFQNVPVFRTQEIIDQRSKLPIIGEEDSIIDAIRSNDVVIIAGETGSGKTTQVPQFLYEAGFTNNDKMIGITEPRRVAAISMASRVATEMNVEQHDLVSYQIRFDDKTKETTKIKFMTDGVLLREVEKDPYLKKYSVIIIDEAHERSVSTDILIGHLSRFVFKRNRKFAQTMGKLRLIIMSATLRVEDFMPNSSRRVQLFNAKPPLINVESRQFDVQVHFNKRTPSEEEYLNEAFRKVSKIHKTLPDGGILVFVTGQDEVHRLCKQLKQAFPYVDKKVDVDKELDKSLKKLPKVDLDAYKTKPEEDNEMNEEEDESESAPTVLGAPLHVLPLFSKLDPKEQQKVFKASPEGHRLCVVATNVAETSLTIPGVKYVVDTGKMKIRLYDKVTGVSTYQVMWTSKAQADQRAGRAGRQGPGHCYRLYSSAVFQDFEGHALPDIKSRPVDDVVLQLKAMGKNKVMDFPFPSPPDLKQIEVAEKHLVQLGALQADDLKRISPLGRTIALFPVSPRYGKMLALSHQHNLTQHCITMVAALSMQEVLLETPIGHHVDAFNKKELAEIRVKWAGKGNTTRLLGDPMVLLSAVYVTEFAGCSKDFCDRHGLRFKAMQEIRKLRRQLANEMATLKVVLDPKTQAPNDEEAFLLRQILLAGLPDQVAHRVPVDELPKGEDKKKLKYAYFTRTMEEPVFLHNLSVLKSEDPPQWVVFQEIYEVKGKMYMRGVTAIDPSWLPEFCPQDCNLSKPLASREPFYEEGQVLTYRSGTFGERGWTLPLIKTVHPNVTERIKLFAKFLLEGCVFAQLKSYQDDLLSSPVTMIKSWGNLQMHGKRTKAFFQALAGHEIDEKEKLVSMLKKEPEFLLKEYLLWLDDDKHNEIKKLWPTLI